MNQRFIKGLAIAALALWVLLFAIDSIIGINWPSTIIQRGFIWFPTIIIGLYFLVYGGKRKQDDQD